MGNAWGLSLALLWSTVASANLKVEHVNINGYDVRIVDTAKSNQFGVVFAVPYGSADDEPRLFGRAHFFEHMFLRGSDRHPGPKTIDENMAAFGFDSNASTGPAQTMYFATGTDEHGLEAMSVLMGSLGRPELLPEPFAKEKETVVDEIVTQAPNRPGRAFHQLPFAVLPAPGHLSRGRFAGDQDTLARMSASDLRDLHEEIYHAGNVGIGVFGNFTSGHLTSAFVIAKLREILPRREPRAPFEPAPRSPALAGERVLSLVNASEREGGILFPVRAGADLRQVLAFTQAFDHAHRGGVLDVGRREKGWINGFATYLQRVGSETFVHVDFEMTEAGYEAREQVANWVLASVERARTEEFSADLITELRRDALRMHKRLEDRVPRLVRSFGGWLGGGEATRDYLDLDWDRAFSRLTPSDIRAGASALDVEHKTLVLMGPDRGGNDRVDAHSRVHFGVKPWTDQASDTPGVSPGAGRASAVELPPPLADKNDVAKNEWHELGHDVVIRTHLPAWADRTVLLRLELPGLTLDERTNLRAWVYSFEEELTSELALLGGRGVTVDLEVETHALEFSATGESGDEFRAIHWLFDRLKHHRANPELVARYKSLRRLSLAKAEHGFAGSVASNLAAELVVPYRADWMGTREALERIDRASVESTWATRLGASQKTLVVAGPADEREIDRLLAAARGLSPGSVPWQRLRGFAPDVDVEYQEPWYHAAQSGFGLARLFAGAEDEDLKGAIALPVVAKAMHKQVFHLARPFGYVQAVAAQNLVNDRYALFMGQAGVAEDVDKVIKIWENELARWDRGAVPAEEIERARQGMRIALDIPAATSLAGASEALVYFRSRRDPFFRQTARETLAKMEVGDFRDTAARYLHPRAKSLTVIKGVGAPETCEAMILGREAVKMALKPRGT